MRCPWAVATILTYCSGTDESCSIDKLDHVHLLRVTNNVVTFNVAPGENYELFMPSNEGGHGIWQKEGLQAVEKVPQLPDRIDPIAVYGYYSLGVWTADANVTQATLRRLAGSNRIGICRINPPDDVVGLAWLAIPWSRASASIWNQPLHDTPSIPLPWITIVIAMIYLQWAKSTGDKDLPYNMVDVLLNASLLADCILWVSLGVVILGESDIEDNTHGHNTIGTYFGLFFASQILLLSRRARWFARSWWLHVLAGWGALFTSGFYLTTVMLWIQSAVLFFCIKDSVPMLKNVVSPIGRLVF